VLKLEPRGKGIVATSLHFANEVHAADGYFAEIPDLELPKEMLELAKHIIHKMAGRFEPDTFEDRYEKALIELIRSKQTGMPVKPQPTHRHANVINLMDALRRSVEGETCSPVKPSPQRPEGRKAVSKPAQSKPIATKLAQTKPARTARKGKARVSKAG
jgi:DNA end-binding protein Ku